MADGNSNNYGASLNYNSFGSGGGLLGDAVKGAAGGAGTGSFGGPVGSVIGAGIGILGSLFGGGDKQESGIKIDPQYEFEMIEQLGTQLEQIKINMTKVTELEQAYAKRVEILQNSVNSMIPDDQVLSQLRDTNVQIAKSLGLSAQELAANGFLSEADAADLESLRALEDENFTDPVLEKQISDSKAQLEQELRRSGASPAIRAQALNEFETQARQERFTRTEELRNNKFQRISNTAGMRTDLQNSNLAQINNSFSTNRSILGDAGANIGLSENLAGAQSVAGYNAIAGQAGLRQEQAGAYEQLGKYKLSGEAKRALSEGVIGPSNEVLQDFRAQESEAKRRRNLEAIRQSQGLR